MSNFNDHETHHLGNFTGADLKLTGCMSSGEAYRQTVAGNISGRRGSSYINCPSCGLLYAAGSVHFCPGQKSGEPATLKITPEDFKIVNANAGDTSSSASHISQNEKEMVNHPEHYAGEIECIDAIRAALSPEEFKGFCKGNAIKYVWRAGKKDKEIQEFKKAVWYLDELI